MRRRKGESIEGYRERNRLAQQGCRETHPTYHRDVLRNRRAMLAAEKMYLVWVSIEGRL